MSATKRTLSPNDRSGLSKQAKIEKEVDPTRVHKIKDGAPSGPVLYWMQRDRRAQDNWALIYAQQQAVARKVPLIVGFAVPPKFLDASIRYYDFMLKGLEELEQELRELNIPFHLLKGYPPEEILGLISRQKIGQVVCDMCPLNITKKWVHTVAAKIDCLHMVDAHNIVPVWIASNKKEFGARTIRPKIHKILDKYLVDFPKVTKHPYTEKLPAPGNFKAARDSVEVNMKVTLPEQWIPGSKAGMKNLETFISNKLNKFNDDRNDPTKEGLSNMSMYFNHGQVSKQRAILIIKKTSNKAGKDAYIEECVIRGELADNFCFYNKDYDSMEGIENWAKTSYKEHRDDKRETIYTKAQLERGETKDELWNAAQRQLVVDGKMHGFLRMYWAKKILEWTETPEDALKFSIYFNDKYSIDGCDPKGYVGVMWAIGGIHDRAWSTRQVFGKIRYMNYQGCKRKFNVLSFEQKYGPKKIRQMAH